MSTQEVADRFYELAKQKEWAKVLDELYGDNARSIEPPSGAAMGLKNVDGLDAIRKKGEEFTGMIEEMHDEYTSEPVVGGTHFSVAMGMDVTVKGAGRMQMNEIAVYEVKDGKIVTEQFSFDLILTTTADHT